MEFGIGPVTAQQTPFDDRSVGEIYRDTVDLMAAGEELGFTSAWVTEHHFVPDGHVSSPLSFVAALASRTESMRIGTGILLPSFYEPIKLAEDVSTVDLLSDGRVTLGLGLGYRDAEFDGFGVPKRERVGRMVETVKFMRRVWTGDPVSFDGEFVQCENLEVTPTPAAGPPVWLGAISESAVRRAARLGEAWMAGPFHPLQGITKRVDWYEEEDEMRELPILRHCFVSEDDAWAKVRDGIEYVERQHYEWDDTEWEEGALDHIRETGFFGTPEEVAADIEAYREELDVDAPLHFLLWFCYPGVSKADTRASLELFADEVMPQFD
jgi:alkanesulfonate monooxygenase SsuD/methylene tetrahydromethanopterin reductase-like flavin-dependent oxidoreductase (luciferase family)